MHVYILRWSQQCAVSRAKRSDLLSLVTSGEGFVIFSPDPVDVYGDHQELCPSEEENHARDI